ncbi:sugar transferase [Gordonia soli]|nr:sugar transferase [Gordonia soli]
MSTVATADGAIDRAVVSGSGAGSPRPTTASWQGAIRRRIRITDAAAIGVGMAAAYLVRYGPGVGDLEQIGVSAVLGVCWMIALEVTRSREALVIGSGVEEFRRVRDASLVPFVMFAVAELWLKLEMARGYVGLSLLFGFVLVNAGRYAWRRRLWRWRASGDCLQRMIVLGADAATINLADSLSHDRSEAIRVVGACIPGYRGDPDAHLQLSDRQIPILGDEHALLQAVTATGADAVAVTATEALGNQHLRELGWRLNDLGVSLLVAPGILDVAEHRVRFASAGSTALIHIQRPQYRGASQISKVTFDRIGAGALILALLPLLLLISAAVKLSSRGPIFYVAPRVGSQGVTFPMIKFRSMRAGADQLKDDLAGQNENDGPLFKMRADPRVTPVGRLLRRYSLDEIPQLFNVLAGHMSLVGPRPHLEREVRAYTTEVQRRMLLKPGMTGLWQVSGRSDLTWDESVRLDLSYVENWSFLLDMYILFKTVKAVMAGDGAY